MEKRVEDIPRTSAGHKIYGCCRYHKGWPALFKPKLIFSTTLFQVPHTIFVDVNGNLLYGTFEGFCYLVMLLLYVLTDIGTETEEDQDRASEDGEVKDFPPEVNLGGGGAYCLIIWLVPQFLCEDHVL